jgi:hypothetical protein
LSDRQEVAPPQPSFPLTFEETATRLALYEWIESRLFEVMGRWVALVPEPDVKLALGALSQEHGWHAQLWRERLPTTERIRAERLASPAGGHLSAFMAALQEPEGEGQTIEKLAGVFRVLLPHLVVAYSRHLTGASVASDGPVARALKLVLNDETEEWRRGEELVQALASSSDGVSRASSQQVLLERLLVESGGLAGLGANIYPRDNGQ